MKWILNLIINMLHKLKQYETNSHKSMSYDYRYTSKQRLSGKTITWESIKKYRTFIKICEKKLNDKRASNCSNYVTAEKQIKIARNLYQKIKSLKKELKLYRNSK